LLGILGNIDLESTFSPVLTEVGGGGGYGLVQWTPVSVLQSHCNILGLSPYTSGDVQIQVILDEITSTDNNLREWYTTSGFISNYYSFGATSDMIGITPNQFLYNEMNWAPEKMAIMFMAGYERPRASQETIHWEQRQSRARFWYEYIQGQVIPADYVARIAPFIRKVFTVTSEFWEQPRNHRGLDISTGAEDTLYSMCNGQVVLVGYDPAGYGNYLIMKENVTGLGFLYGHLRDVPMVRQGDTIYKGQPVGIEGTTGHSTGIHLHLEMQPLAMRDWIFHGDREDYINPAEFMDIPNQEGITAVYYGASPTPTPSVKFKKMNINILLNIKKKKKKFIDIR
jgi:murein DD-endopeptidase MepM/ murein hydrolase activator NlpD